MNLRVRRRLSFGLAVLTASIAHAALLRLPLDQQPLTRVLGEAHPVVWLASSTPPALSTPAPAIDSLPNANVPVDAANSPQSALSDSTVADHRDESPRESPSNITRPDMPPDQATLSPEELARYHPAKELSVRARVTSPIDLEMNPDPHDVRGGQARFIVLISALGSVDKVAVENSTLSANFLSFSLSKLHGAQFTPGQIGGVAVPARVIIEVSDTPG